MPSPCHKLLLLAGVVAAPSTAIGQITTPSNASLYWGASGHDWNADIAAYGGCVFPQPDGGYDEAICPPCMEADGPALMDLCRSAGCNPTYLACLLDAGPPLSVACADAVASLARQALDAGQLP